MFHTLTKLTVTFAIVSSSFVNCVIHLSQDEEDTFGEANMTNQIYVKLQNVSISKIDNYLKLVNKTSSKPNTSKLPFYLPSLSSILGIDPYYVSKPIEISYRDLIYPQFGVLDLSFRQIRVMGLSSYKLKEVSKEGKNIILQHFLSNLTAQANYSVNFTLFDHIPVRVSRGEIKVGLKNVHLNATFLMLPKTLKSWFKVFKLNLTVWSNDEPNMLAFPEFIITREYPINETVMQKINEFIKSLMPSLTQYLKFTYSKLIELY